MKRPLSLICLALGLLLAPVGSSFGDPALGRSDDRRRDYRDEHRNRGGDHQRSVRSGERRPLGTLPDDRGYHDRRYGGDHNPGRHHGSGRRDGGDDHRGNHYGTDRRAADAVRRREHGRVLSTEPDDDRGYRVRVLTPDGYVRERYVDPHDRD